MSWIAVSLGSAAIPAAINLGMAAHQAHKAHKLAKTPRPEYQIPQAQTQALNNASYMANQTELPGQNIMQQKIDQGSAGALANLKDVSQSGSALGSNIANIYRGNVGAQNQLNLAGAQNWNANQANYRDQLGLMGTAQDKQWTINKFDPYRNNMAAASAMREGSFRNLSAAGKDLSALGTGFAAAKMAQGPTGPSDVSSGKTGFGQNSGVNSESSMYNEGSTSFDGQSYDDDQMREMIMNYLKKGR